MQVRQCEATVGFTGRDQGHVTSPWHCTASNRTVPYHTHPVNAVVIRFCLPLSIAAHGCPTPLADWPPPKRVALCHDGWDGRVQPSGERVLRGRSVPRLVKSIHTRLLGRNQSNPWPPSEWLPSCLHSNGMGCKLETKQCHNCI